MVTWVALGISFEVFSDPNISANLSCLETILICGHGVVDDDNAHDGHDHDYYHDVVAPLLL